MRVLLVLALLASACTQSNDTCSYVCGKQAKCEESMLAETTFDRNECEAACTALLNDKESAPLVQRHFACTQAALDGSGDTCPAILACH